MAVSRVNVGTRIFDDLAGPHSASREGGGQAQGEEGR